jgi:tRNA (cmo5U34)-methyltransferase
VDIICADIFDVNFQLASVVVLNFTLQFIHPDVRLRLLKKIYNGMVPGAILILSEKIAFFDQQRHQCHIDLHHAFKRANGYSELEISQKRTALENVLIPDTLTQHRQRFNAAGFRFYDIWFQCFNFVSMLALK